MRDIHPRARQTDLVIEEAGDELLVYDEQRELAHRLNKTSAIVFRNCDGERSVADLVAIVAEQVDEVADEDLVMIALDNLAEAGLLEDFEQREPEETRTSRRRFIRRVGVVGSAALVLPVVHSIIAPTTASAASTSSSCSCSCGCTCPCIFCGCSGCICPCGSTGR